MRRIDELHLDYPFAGSRMLRDLLRREGVDDRPPACRDADEAHGDRSDLSRPNTSKPAPGHKIYPYLLRDVTIERPNQVWAMDITYIPMRRGFVYLAAVVDVVQPARAGASRVDHHGGGVLRRSAGGGAGEAWQARDFQHGSGQPIHQRSTSRGVLLNAKIAISMDGKGAWRDNVFVERLWRSVKYEEVYLQRLRQRVRGARLDWPISGLLQQRRPHSSLDGRTPDEAYFGIKQRRWPHDRRRPRVQ